MGQRFQIVIKTPEEYWNENNCNNIDGRILVYHCQWLYGYFAVRRMGNLIKGIKSLLAQEIKHKKEAHTTYPITYDEIINKAINWISHNELHNQIKIHPYFDEGFKFDKNAAAWKEELNTWDNNNGIFFLEIDKNNNIKYCFYNPAENESEEIRQEKIIDWKEYLKDYRDENFKTFLDYNNSVKELEQTNLLKSLPKIKDWMIKKETVITTEEIKEVA